MTDAWFDDGALLTSSSPPGEGDLRGAGDGHQPPAALDRRRPNGPVRQVTSPSTQPLGLATLRTNPEIDPRWVRGSYYRTASVF